MNSDFSLKACMDSVKFEVEELNVNPFELLGRFVIRSEEDVFFNKTMITAVKQYIKENNII